MKSLPILALSAALLAPVAAKAQVESLDLTIGMKYQEVKNYVSAHGTPNYRDFGPANLAFSGRNSNGITTYILIKFCSGTSYDGAAVEILSQDFFSPIDSKKMIARFREIYSHMTGDDVGAFVSTRTETKDAAKEGISGVAFANRLQNGQTWELGIFNRSAVDLPHDVQLVRTAPPETVCRIPSPSP